MESPTPVSRYVSQSSKKRVFSSSVFNDDEVLEIPPPSTINRASKPNSSKQKEVICHEIIDLDIEEDHADVFRIEGSSKGKKALSNSSASLCNFTSDGSGSDIQKSKHGAINDFNPNLFYGEDQWIATYYDDIVYDDFSVLDFDHMDIPPGVEAPFPWLSSSPENDTKARGLTTSSSKIGNQAASHNPKKKLSSRWSESGPSLTKTASSSRSRDVFTSKTSGGSLSPGNLSSSRKSKRLRASLGSSSQFSSGATLASTVHNHSSYLTLKKISSSAPGVGIHMPSWSNSPLNILEPPIGPSTFTNGSGYIPLVQDSANNNLRVASARVDKRNADEILQDFVAFKSFDTVDDYSDHHFAKHDSSANLAQKNWAKRIQEEWKILEKDLPDTIFVRVYESRMDLLRAVIIGAEGTPYHDGLFFFDVFFPSNYPTVPPKVHYHSGGLRINPNLYNCGKVCLSLLNTWSGHGREKWIPRVSTMLQVLVSIQGLILNAKPYFNEPGYADLGGTKHGEEKSLAYNERTFMYTLQTMVYSMRRPPKYFEAYVQGHFCKRAREILVSCKAYLDGAQVGCLVKGGVQDVDEGDKSCSKDFRNSLARYITTLVNEFSQIGAKDCQEFLCLSQKANGPAPATSGAVNFYM
ncbi:probable ubiquitin-conjugating enzyme E2 25 isoform X3 [Salvia miltiorrhiza]|nr:probable ubiquitin-conjugating enzyme E2 25 isoform X3 [Salvia miltiorrhiza]XP_057811201.1 probable ubiquitin-conjugating enzyme E2 25 isoform X3 [Salvia miltiorrhiza]